MAKIYDEKINKSTDWGGDESTGNLPVSGHRVQEFIKEQLNGKAGVFYYDTTNNRYIVFADAESRDAYLADPSQTSLIIGTFDAPFNYSAQITLSTPTYVAILSETKNNYIDFTFDTVNKSGQSVGEDVMCTYTFIKGGIKKVVTEKYRYGQAVHFNIDNYISVGTNTITVGVVGQNTLAATTVGITYQVVDLQLYDTYDISQAYNITTNPGASAAIPYAVSGYGTKIMEWYVDGVALPYIKVEDEIVDVATTRTKYISLSNLSQGIHSLQYRAYTMVDGEKFYSNILYRDLIVVTGVNKNPIIAVSATIPVGNDIIVSGNLQLYGITQYIPYDLFFSVYNPSSVVSTQATITVDGRTEATIQTHNGEVNTYSIRATEYGLKTLAIKAGETTYTIGLNISKSSTSLEPITDALQLDLQALGKSNNDVNKEEWVYGLYSATFTGFNWNKTSGWNNNRLLITSGAYVDINLAPLTPDPTVTGKTLEFEFATANVNDDNAVICDLRNTSGTGMLITASEVKLKSAGGAEVSTKFKSEENIRVAFVVNRKTGVTNKGLVFIYVNGICCGAVNYASTDNFTSDKTIRIGGTQQADVELKALRFYNAALSSDQVLNNYMLYRDTTSEMLSIYDKNNVYEEGTQNFSVDRLAAQCPVVIFTGDIPTLENTTDKNETIYVDVEYINMQEPARSFKSQGTRLRPQGTSSMGYPKKNFRPYTNYGTMWDSLGNVITGGLYAFADRAQPVSCWCLKADYAESSGTHNTGIARLWNQVMTNTQVNGEYVLRTNAQKAAIAAKYAYDVRTTVDGFPVNVFYRLTADSELIYIGKYNFNNDKSTESVFGFRDIPGFDNTRMQCWEVLNNGNHLALFQDMNNFDAEWDQAYEARYPDGSTNTADLKAFSEWVVSTKGNVEKFKTEKWQHLDVYKVAAYYIYLMRFGAVDQVVKNAMMTSEDGEHFYFINYDNDTINAVRNDGLLIYNYDIDRQSVDTSFSALVYAYAGHESTLWNNLEADSEFMQVVSEIDNALYIAGLTYDKTIEMFDNKQSVKWCERVYNQDAQYKYIQPYTDSGINNLFMLQGNRSAHRRWWLSHRFDLLDSKFVSGAYKAKSIEFKAANAPIGLQFSLTSGNNIYYGYGLNNVPVETGIRLASGKSHTFTTKQVVNVGDPLRIYSAVNVQELDIHNFIPYLSTLNIAEVYDDEVGTKLKKLVMGVNTSTDSRRNTSLSTISGLSQAKRLEYLDISGYQTIINIDLSMHPYLTTLKAYESGLTGLVLANGSPITTLELPDSMQVLRLDSLPNLSTGLDIKNYGRNLTNIYIRNCPNFDSKAFVANWNTNKLTASRDCSLTLEGIRWTGISPTTLIALGDIGALSMKGVIELTSVTLAQITQIREIFGENCTNPTNELYIKAPDGIFLVGPTSVLEGDSVQYSAVVFSSNLGKIEFYIVNGSTESSSYDGVSIDKDTGLLTSTEVGRLRNTKIRAKHIPPTGAAIVTDSSVSVVQRTYPTSVSIIGRNSINQVGSYDYALEVTPPAVNGRYTTEWALTGEAVEQGILKLGVTSKEKCIISTASLPVLSVVATLTVTLRKVSDSSVIKATSKDISVLIPGVIMTKLSNPTALAVCHAQGWCGTDYMTEEEASRVTSMGRGLFTNVNSFDEFQYFIGITELVDEQFYNSLISSIKLPPSIEKLGARSLGYCTRLTYLDLTNVTALTTLGSSCFSRSYCRTVKLPKNVTNISEYSFEDMIYLTSIEVDKENKTYSSLDGCLYDIDKTELFKCPNAIDPRLISYPQSLKVLGNRCFATNAKLTGTFVIPPQITTVGGYFVTGCLSIKEIVFPEGLIEMRSRCLWGSLAEKINIPDSLQILNYASFGTIKMEEYVLPKGLKTIKEVFTENSSVKKISFKDNEATFLTQIPNGFCMSSSVQTIILPSTIDYIGTDSFKNCKMLVNIDLSHIKTIRDRAFEGTSSLETIDLSSVKSIGYTAFSGSNLSTVSIPVLEGEQSSDMFASCKNLLSAELLEGNTKVFRNMFVNCSNLSQVKLPNSLLAIETYAFSGTGLTSLALPGKLTILKNYCLARCLSLKTITSKGLTAPTTESATFGNSDTTYAGRNSYDQSTNILYVPAGSTGYDQAEYLDPLQNATKCGFTLSKTL